MLHTMKLDVLVFITMAMNQLAKKHWERHHQPFQYTVTCQNWKECCNCYKLHMEFEFEI